MMKIFFTEKAYYEHMRRKVEEYEDNAYLRREIMRINEKLIELQCRIEHLEMRSSGHPLSKSEAPFFEGIGGGE